MNIVVTGSLAYDRIMDFSDKFRDHIIPEKVHMLSVSFVVDTLEQKHGGTSGNIAYNLKILDIDPTIVGSAGKDFENYITHLKEKNISTEYIRIFEDEYTAVASIITDLDGNQISAFYPGALGRGQEVHLPENLSSDDFLVISPSSKSEMSKRILEARKYDIPYMFDPGQQMTTLSAEELSLGAENSSISIFNDYEWQMFNSRTDISLQRLIDSGVVVIVTKGHVGSTIHTKSKKYEIGTAKPKQVLDPTGAGDAYRSGIIAGFINNWEWDVAGELAATIASFAIEHYGTQEHNPSIDDINARYKENFIRESPFFKKIKNVIRPGFGLHQNV